MITKMILMTVLILAILFATWVKDRERMDPPFKRRLVIDLTVIFSLWVLYAFIYLIAKISPIFAGLLKVIKKNGVNIPEVEEEQTEDKKE